MQITKQFSNACLPSSSEALEPVITTPKSIAYYGPLNKLETPHLSCTAIVSSVLALILFQDIFCIHGLSTFFNIFKVNPFKWKISPYGPLHTLL